MRTVSAIGWNVLPSTPEKVSKRNVDEDDDELAVDGRADDLVRGLRDGVEALVLARARGRAARWRSARCRRLFSAMITAPSTIRPKSSAPRLIRLALILTWSMPIGGNQHGDRDDQRRDKRGPEIAEQQEQDQYRPGTRPPGGSSPRSGRWRRRAGCGSSTVRTRMPGGSVRLISLILASTAAATVRLLPPTSISTVPSTASWPFMLALPRRKSRPIVTVGDVLDMDRNVAAGGDDDVADFGQRLDPAAGAHHIALAEALDVVGAAARIVGLDRAHQLADGQAVSDELRRRRAATWYCLT